MFAVYLIPNAFGTKLSKTIHSSGTRQNPIQTSNLSKDRLDPEPGRTSRACGIRLSQNMQNNALHASVNKNARIFAPILGSRSTRLGSSRRDSV
jgi:hypothetical protein